MVEAFRFPEGRYDYVVIASEPDGAYLFVFRREDLHEPAYDYRLNTVDEARNLAAARWHVPGDGWRAMEPDEVVLEPALAYAREKRDDGDRAWGCLREIGGCLTPSLSVLVLVVFGLLT